jgi:hypothetical protein
MPGTLSLCGFGVDGRAEWAWGGGAFGGAVRWEPSPTERRADTDEGRLDVADNQRFVQPKHTVAAASQHCIPARISALAPAVVAAIDLEHEPLSRREKISDETTEQRNLATKHDAQLAPTNASPDQLLGHGRRHWHDAGTLFEDYGARCAAIANKGLLLSAAELGRERRTHFANGQASRVVAVECRERQKLSGLRRISRCLGL